LSQDITGSLLAVAIKYNSSDALYNSAFYHTGWYYEYRKISTRRVTVLHIAKNCKGGSLVKINGLTQIKIWPSAHHC